MSIRPYIPLSAVLAALLITLAPLPVATQAQAGQYRRGMVQDEEGGWRLPTPAEALEAVRLRESDQVELEAGGDDPFREAFRRFQNGESQRWEVSALSGALGDVLLMEDSAYRGPEYVLALFEGSDPPAVNRLRNDPADRGSTWCEAGFLLYAVAPTLPDVRDAAWRTRVPDRQREYERLCSGPLVR